VKRGRRRRRRRKLAADTQDVLLQLPGHPDHP
jgi:hypothetical protein